MREPNEDEEKRISAAILILLFHEFGRNLKNYINNLSDSPRIIFSPNLNLKSLNLYKFDSEFLLEFLFVKGFIEVEKFIYSENSEKLLNKDLYLGLDFDYLRNILTSIGFKTIEKHHINVNYDKLNYQQLTKLFAEMDEETFKDNQEAYKYSITKFFGNPDKKC